LKKKIRNVELQLSGLNKEELQEGEEDNNADLKNELAIQKEDAQIKLIEEES